MQALSWRRIGTALLLDLGAPIALTVATVHELAYDGSPVAKWVGALAMVWILVLRRRVPVVTMAVCLALAASLWAWSSPTVADLALLAALYSVARHRTFRIAAVAAVVLEAALVAAAFRYAPADSVDDYVVVLSGVAAAALFLGTTLRANSQYLRAVEDRAAQLEHDRAQQAEIGAAAERARIAREMHDIVAHSLAVVITLSEGAAVTATRDPDAAAALMRQVAGAGRTSLEEMRRLLQVLRSDDPTGRAPQPDLAMLPALLDDVRAAGLAVELVQDVPPGSLERSAETTVFRVVQEALTNVLKHARSATRVAVRIAIDGGSVTFSVADDGRSRPGSVPGDGNGVLGMTERVGLFGGTVSAGPSSDGWVVDGGFPLRAAAPVVPARGDRP